MQDTELYRQILGLPAPWRVANVQLDLDEVTVRVFVEYDAQQAVWKCPECDKVCPVYDHREPRQWRHLDSCQFLTYLVASLPRVHCPTHGVQTVSVFWSEQNSRFTHLFERFALDVLRATKIQSQAARLLRLSAGQLHDLMHRAVARGLSRRDREETIWHLSLDEKSFQKGHQYITALSDPGRKRVLEVVQDRTLEAVHSLLETTLTAKQRQAVRSVSMDMWPASLQYVRKISGFHKPSKANEEAFNTAVAEIARITEQLLGSLESHGLPKNREEEATKAKASSVEKRNLNAFESLLHPHTNARSDIHKR